MPDNDNGSGGDSLDAKTLRGKLEQALERIGKLETANSELQQDRQRLQLHDAGLGMLNPRQQRVILRELKEEGTDPTPENMKQAALDLNFAKESDFKQPGQNGQNGQQQNGQQQQLGPNGLPLQQQPGMPPLPPGVHPAELIENDLAQRMSALTGVAQQGMAPPQNNMTSGAAFEQLMKEAKSGEEVDAIIRAYGPQHGIMLEDDMN